MSTRLRSRLSDFTYSIAMSKHGHGYCHVYIRSAMVQHCTSRTAIPMSTTWTWIRTWTPGTAVHGYGTDVYDPVRYTTIQAVQPYSNTVQPYYGTVRPDAQLYSQTVQHVNPRRLSQCTAHRASWLAGQYAYAAGWLT